MTQEKRPSAAQTAMARVSRVLDGVQRALMAAIVVILSISALLLLWQVIDRLAFGRGQNWIEEYARLSLIWLTFLGAAVLIREGKHLTVEYFVEKFPKAVRTVVAYGVDILLVGLLTLLLLQISAVWASSAVLVSPSLGIPRTVLALAAFVSYGISMVFLLESIARRALGMPPVRRLATEDSAESMAV